MIRFDKDNYYVKNKECPKCYNKTFFKIEQNSIIQKNHLLEGEIQE